MKITKSQLKQLIKEELANLEELVDPDAAYLPRGPMGDPNDQGPMPDQMQLADAADALRKTGQEIAIVSKRLEKLYTDMAGVGAYAAGDGSRDAAVGGSRAHQRGIATYVQQLQRLVRHAQNIADDLN